MRHTDFMVCLLKKMTLEIILHFSCTYMIMRVNPVLFVSLAEIITLLGWRPKLNDRGDEHTMCFVH